MKRLFVIVVLIGISASDVSAEETMRCGSKIISVGMTTDDVLKYCGKPSSIEVEEHDVRSGGRVVGKTQLNIWTYNRGTVGKPKVLEFDQEKLIAIK